MSILVLWESVPKYYGKIKYRTYQCVCRCGNLFTCLQAGVKSGGVKTCGCVKHGLRNHPLYNVWSSMIDRCGNANNKSFYNYGGRGIEVTDEWKKFMSFYNWASAFYSKGLQLDRIDNNLGYCPDNCRFVTRVENNRNKRTNHLITYLGETKTIAEWAEIYGIEKSKLRSRLFISKWTMLKSISQ